MEKLKKYLNNLSVEQQNKFAQAVGTSVNYLRKKISMGIPPGAKICTAIELESQNQVSRIDLCGRKMAKKIWPELEYQNEK